MNGRQACFSVLASVGTISSAFAQEPDKQDASVNRHHTVVPLPRSREVLNNAMKMPKPEVVSGDPDNPGAPFVIRKSSFRIADHSRRISHAGILMLRDSFTVAEPLSRA